MVDLFVATKKAVKKKKKVEEGKKYGLGPGYVRVEKRLKNEKEGDRLGLFNVLPDGLGFETQESREKIILLLRQHWVLQLRWILIVMVMMVVPLGLRWIPLLDFLPSRFQFMAVVMWYLLVIAFVFEQFISWLFHVFIITDERVIDIDFYNMLHKVVSEAKIDNIEDVTYSHGGTFSTWFNYGTVNMQTAAEKREFEISCVPQPSRVAKILNELKLEEEQEKLEGRVR